MFEKVWEAHEVGYDLLFIDLHLVHEVTSPQAFEGCDWRAARCAAPIERWRPPTTTSRPAPASPTSSASCSSTH